MNDDGDASNALEIFLLDDDDDDDDDVLEEKESIEVTRKVEESFERSDDEFQLLRLQQQQVIKRPDLKSHTSDARNGSNIPGVSP